MANIRIAQRWERTKWFRQARFGMFIHWGLYAIPARGEWVRSVESISNDDYQCFYNEFNPSRFDPVQWARLAKKAGMQYAVLTAKHHDGFCLFDSQLTDYKSTNTPFGRDIVREFLEAFRAEGIKTGLYFSLIDWHHPDYPHYQDAHHPMRKNPDYPNDTRNFSRYLDYLHGQVRELLTGYGNIDIMWFDFSYNEMNGEKWKASELVAMARELQPHIIIDNRLEGSGESSGTILTADPTAYAGDFAAPEQMIPPAGVVNVLGDPVPWEACVTLNNNWGYHAGDRHYKQAGMVVRMLVECVSKNGNLLLNVGPDALGRIPDESVKVLEQVGRWMDVNAESIYGCGQADYPKPEWGRYTQKGNKLYIHVLEEQAGAICLADMAGKINSLRLLNGRSQVRLTSHWNVKEYPHHAYFFLNEQSCDNYPLPDEKDTVLEATLGEGTD